MAGISVGRCGLDTVGQWPLLNPPTPSRVFVNGRPIAVVGTKVTPHMKGIHQVSTMKQGSTTVKAGGLPVCGTGHMSDCAHTLISSSNVFIGG